MKQNKKHITLEKSLERLENIVKMLESDQTNIDDSMHLYKECHLWLFQSNHLRTELEFLLNFLAILLKKVMARK